MVKDLCRIFLKVFHRALGLLLYVDEEIVFVIAHVGVQALIPASNRKLDLPQFI